MAHVTLPALQAWGDGTKLILANIDTELETQLSSMIISQLSSAFNVSTWVDPTTTPSLVRQIICMYYVATIYNRTYAEEGELVPYASLLMAQADKLIEGIISGSIIIVDTPVGSDNQLGGVAFYPTDNSSAADPNWYDTSLGDAKFSMGRIF